MYVNYTKNTLHQKQEEEEELHTYIQLQLQLQLQVKGQSISNPHLWYN